mmetsp:Transcript_38583/g.66221  ORF Transcript_38583/g.66221 Transcript_38583/m.66221 type:complete len:147 (+) Transcript_38583:28-468(+)
MHKTVLFVLLVAPHAAALQLGAVRSARQPSTARASSLQMGMFDGLKGAFANDDTLGARDSAGLSKQVQKKTITWISPTGATKKSTVFPGQKLKDIARGTGLRITYDCNEGTCKSCEAMIDGRKTLICCAKAPNKDVTIKYNTRSKK